MSQDTYYIVVKAPRYAVEKFIVNAHSEADARRIALEESHDDAKIQSVQFVRDILRVQ